jgi:hypothetical protein
MIQPRLPGSWLAIVQPHEDILIAQMAKVIDRLNPHITTLATLTPITTPMHF